MVIQKLTPDQAEQVWIEVNEQLDKALMHIVDGKPMWLVQSPLEIDLVRTAVNRLGAHLASVYDLFDNKFGCITVYDSEHLDAVRDCAEQALFDLYAETAAQRILGILG